MGRNHPLNPGGVGTVRANYFRNNTFFEKSAQDQSYRA